MVCYCCVKGCKNNSNIKKKDPSISVSFHTFPSNPELKHKWLRAIGRPNWNPPTHARICSAHFSYDQISLDGVRTRISDNACPVNDLPPNSNFEATHMQVCRICLADDVKMYSVHTELLRTSMESIIGFNENANIEGLPQFVCYLCAALLVKCYKLVERSLAAQVTLLDIFTQNGQITKSLIRKQNRNELKLTTELQSYNVTPSTIFEFKCTEEHNSTLNEDITNSLEKETVNENRVDDYNSTMINKREALEKEEKPVTVVNEEIDDNDDITGEGNFHDHGTDSDASIESDEVNQIDSKKTKLQTKPSRRKPRVLEKVEKDYKGRSRRIRGLVTSEVKLQEHFNIVKLSLDEQIEQWKKAATRENCEYEYRCDECGKLFAHKSSLRNHTYGHDPTRGPAQCAVCKLRFRSDALVRSHAKYTHSMKLHCKTCPKYYTNIAMAKKHRNYHAGLRYSCGQCAFSSRHVSARAAHVRTCHAACTCALCGRAAATPHGLRVHVATAHAGAATEKAYEFKCEECNLSFATEVARRVHTLTSNKHRKKTDLCDPTPRDPALSTACKACGEQFDSRRELVSHVKSQHPRKTSWSLPDDRYPQRCEHCEVTVTNRSEHWSHVRRKHPTQRHSYRAVVNAVCETCGKGFQNKTKLHLHELRHGRPAVACPRCPKRFYDTQLLRTHMHTHSDARPHACALCARSFKCASNLLRHARVHTDVATYECTLCGKKFKYSSSLNTHVRTVHYKIPPPPRKKRARTKNQDTGHDNRTS